MRGLFRRAVLLELATLKVRFDGRLEVPHVGCCQGGNRAGRVDG